MKYFFGFVILATVIFAAIWGLTYEIEPTQSELIVAEFSGPDVTIVKQCPTKGDVDSYVFQKGEKFAVLFVNDNFFTAYHFAERINVAPEEFC